MIDQYNNLGVETAIDPETYTATVSGDIIDLALFESVTFTVITGAVTTADGSHYFTFTLNAGDDSALSDGATVTASTGLLGSNLVINNASTQDDVCVGKMGYVGSKRYIQLVATETGTATALFGAVVIRGNARHMPVS